MNLIKAKTVEDIPVKGVSVDFETVDGAILGITIRDESGSFFKVVRESDYSKNLTILVKQPEQIKTLLNATFTLPDGGKVSYVFEDIETLKAKMESLLAEEYDVEYIEKVVEIDPLSGKEKESDDIPF